MNKIGGALPDCILFNSVKKKFILLKANGNLPNPPGIWGIWEKSLIDLEHAGFEQIVSESEALKLLPDEIVQLRV